jgi:short-subunit dehydrogenase
MESKSATPIAAKASEPDSAGRLWLVTGASSGIGAATALAAARRGIRLALVARSAGKLAAVAEEVQRRGGSATTHACDVADHEQVAQLASEVPTPDVIFNNAGAGKWKPLVETSPEEAATMIAAPYLAAFYVTRVFLPAMLARKSGTVVYMNSAASRLVWPGAAAYMSTRWAVRGLFESVRAETHGTGVRAGMVTFAKVASDYWENNPGSETNVPKAQAWVPVLSPDAAAKAILDGIEAGQEEIISPWQLRVAFLMSRLFPSLSRSLMRPTSSA